MTLFHFGNPMGSIAITLARYNTLIRESAPKCSAYDSSTYDSIF